MNIEISNKEKKVLLDALYNHELCKSSCYMNYEYEIECGVLNKQNQYKCELQRIVNGLLNKLGENL